MTTPPNLKAARKTLAAVKTLQETANPIKRSEALNEIEHIARQMEAQAVLDMVQTENNRLYASRSRRL